MCNTNALKGFAVGVLAAILVAVMGIAPVLARGGGPSLLPKDRAQAPHSVESQAIGGGSPLVIPAAAFTNDGLDPDGFFFDFAGGYVDGRGSACLKAAAYLPDGAFVTQVWTTVYDNATGSVSVNLQRVDNYTGVTNAMAAASTSTNSTSIQRPSDLSIGYYRVRYPYYSYYVTTCLSSSDHRLYSVRIYYVNTVFLPLILKRF